MYPIRAPEPYHYSQPVGEPAGAIDRVIVIGMMAVMVGCALAFGTVEPWSMATLGLLIMAFLVLWGIKA